AVGLGVFAFYAKLIQITPQLIEPAGNWNIYFYLNFFSLVWTVSSLVSTNWVWEYLGMTYGHHSQILPNDMFLKVWDQHGLLTAVLYSINATNMTVFKWFVTFGRDPNVRKYLSNIGLDLHDVDKIMDAWFDEPREFEKYENAKRGMEYGLPQIRGTTPLRQMFSMTEQKSQGNPYLPKQQKTVYATGDGRYQQIPTPIDHISRLNFYIQSNPRFAPFPTFDIRPSLQGNGWVCEGMLCGQSFSATLMGLAVRKADAKQECAKKMMDFLIEESVAPGTPARASNIKSTRTSPVVSPSALPPSSSPTAMTHLSTAATSAPVAVASSLPVNPISLLQEHIQYLRYPPSSLRYEEEQSVHGHLPLFRLRVVFEPGMEDQVTYPWSEWRGRKKDAKEEAARKALEVRHNAHSTGTKAHSMREPSSAALDPNATLEDVAAWSSHSRDTVVHVAPTAPAQPNLRHTGPLPHAVPMDLSEEDNAWREMDEMIEKANAL
ncbi:hypothetical protein HDU93_002683, partial [Gonapodya sp. JEL0774]